MGRAQRQAAWQRESEDRLLLAGAFHPLTHALHKVTVMPRLRLQVNATLVVTVTRDGQFFWAFGVRDTFSSIGQAWKMKGTGAKRFALSLWILNSILLCTPKRASLGDSGGGGCLARAYGMVFTQWLTVQLPSRSFLGGPTLRL